MIRVIASAIATVILELRGSELTNQPQVGRQPFHIVHPPVVSGTAGTRTFSNPIGSLPCLTSLITDLPVSQSWIASRTEQTQCEKECFPDPWVPADIAHALIYSVMKASDGMVHGRLCIRSLSSFAILHPANTTAWLSALSIPVVILHSCLRFRMISLLSRMSLHERNRPMQRIVSPAWWVMMSSTLCPVCGV